MQKKCMNSTGRWVHGMTKLDTDCNHRNTAWGERHMSPQSSEMKPTNRWRRRRRRRRRSRKKNKKKETLPPNRCDSLTALPGSEKIKKQQFVLFFFSDDGGGKKEKRKYPSSVSVLHNTQIPHACAEETSWRRFWSSSCIGIFSHPSGSVGEPWGWTCLRMPCCSEGRRTASLLSVRKKEDAVRDCVHLNRKRCQSAGLLVFFVFAVLQRGTQLSRFSRCLIQNMTFVRKKQYCPLAEHHRNISKSSCFVTSAWLQN